MGKSLIIFYSRKGYNYANGNIVNLEIGNTEVAANIIKQITNSDIFKVETEKEYPTDYHETTEVAKKELRESARPALKKYIDSIDEYDTIYIGYPNWWGTMPMAMYTFIEKYDFLNKIIIPFCTHEGSGMGYSEREIKKLCPNSIVKEGLAIHGTNVRDAKINIEKWIKK